MTVGLNAQYWQKTLSRMNSISNRKYEQHHIIGEWLVCSDRIHTPILGGGGVKKSGG